MWAPDLNSLVYHGSPEAKDIIQQVRTQKFPSICPCCLQNLLFLLFFLLLSRLFFSFVFVLLLLPLAYWPTCNSSLFFSVCVRMSFSLSTIFPSSPLNNPPLQLFLSASTFPFAMQFEFYYQEPFSSKAEVAHLRYVRYNR